MMVILMDCCVILLLEIISEMIYPLVLPVILHMYLIVELKSYVINNIFFKKKLFLKFNKFIIN